MQAERPTRRLAAILAADVVGYSRLMAADEAGTFARLKAHRRELIDSTIGAHHGRIVKLMGDGALVEFASALDAVQCAVAIQRGTTERNAGVPEEHRIAFRIGINLGDVIAEDGDIYGDGVNVAARLQGLAEPGGVCISDAVHQIVRANAGDLGFTDLGEQQMKNLARPIRAWRWPAGTETGAAAVKMDGPPLPLPDKPSIAVLPFDNMSGDRGQDYFSDGITEDLITDLSQISGLFVIARNSVFRYKGRPVAPQQVSRELGVRYVLEGSVRRAASRIRINAQLIDAATGYHLWARRYDGELEDVFALQDEITGSIVAALEVALTRGEQERLVRRYTDNLEAYDLFLRARDHQLRRTREGLARAREALEEAIELDPTFAGAYAVLADNYRQEWLFGWRDDADVLDRALNLARNAVALDGELPLARTLLGWIHLWRKRHEQAIAEAERAIALDPNHAEGHARLGHILDFAGRPEAGVPFIEKAMRLDPHFPFLYLFFLGHAYQSMERYEEAVAAYRRAVGRNPDHIGAHEHLAAAYGRLGRIEEARAEAAETLRLSPNFSVQREARRLPYRDPAALDRLVDGLRRAGLPD